MIFSIFGTMKRILFLSMIILAGNFGANAQKSFRIGYVDMEYILENVPEYQQAATQLDTRVKDWREVAEKNRREIQALKEELENEKALLTKELVEEREEEITYREEQAAEYEQNRFGPNGDYIIQKKQLIRPIQDQVFTAVQEIAENRNLDMVFDRTSESGMVYASRQLDISDQVLRSINRASNRRQLDSKDEIEEFEREENRTVEEDAEIAEKEKAVKDNKSEREALIEERKRQRDSIKEARQREFEERRNRILEERKRKKDSIQAIRNQKDTIN